MLRRELGVFAMIGLLVGACGGEPAAAGASDEPGDAADGCGLCAGKADGWSAPAEGSCEAGAIIDIANDASFEELDVDAGLNRIAAENIVERRDIDGAYASLAAIDAVPYVGAHALGALLEYAGARGLLDACVAAGPEIGIVSDLDKTVIPPHEQELPEVAPYPGVATLYELLELRLGGESGDVHYVTARTPDGVAKIPEWLALHDVPPGSIDTGISGVPWIAQAEKVRDISAILDAKPQQRFVLFGDSSHRDPEVYREIQAKYPDRIAAGLIQQVTESVSPSRVEGLLLHSSYAEAAAMLFGLGLLDESEARAVMQAAREEGLPIDEAEMDALIELHRP
jgi:hypothetical protein